MRDYKNKNNQQIYSWAALGSILVFAGFKLSDVSLPYFWDELGVYAKASLYMADHKLSLLPGDLPPVLSRGHPLLFQFIYALGYSGIGKSVMIGHSISLLITLFLLFVVYFQVASIYNRLIGFLSIVLLMSQPVFIAQSTLVLPEMMLSLFAFMAILSYYKRAFWAFAIYSSLALLVKESAIVVPFIAFAYGFWSQVILKKKEEFLSLRSLLLTATPLVVFGGFLVIQKWQNGWFFFPEHIGYVSFDLTQILWKNHNFQRFLFFEQGRYWWVKVFIVAVPFAAIKGRLRLNNSLVLLSIITVIAFLSFSCVNFYMNRYLLVAFPFLAILVAVSIYTISERVVVAIPLTILLSLLSLRDIDPGYFNYDCDMGFKHHLQVEQQLIDKICQTVTDTTCVGANFPLYFVLTEQESSGFKLCENIPHLPEDSCGISLYAFTSENGTFPLVQAQDKLLFSVKESYAEGRLYERHR